MDSRLVAPPKRASTQPPRLKFVAPWLIISIQKFVLVEEENSLNAIEGLAAWEFVRPGVPPI
jgi:hypothetical protein